MRDLAKGLEELGKKLGIGGKDSLLSSPGTWLKNRTGISFGFQHGGLAPGGKSILVGEAGPEILTTPPGGAMITPNNELGGGSVVVNGYSDVGRKITEAEAGIRIEIEDRANRNNQFPALLA